MKCPIYGECLMDETAVIVDIPVSPGLEKWRKGEITFKEYSEELKRFVEKNKKDNLKGGGE